MGQGKGVVFGNVGSQIHSSDVVAPSELGKGVRNPERLRGRLLRKNEILIRGYQNYQFKDEIPHPQTKSMEHTKRLERGEPYLKFREDFLACLRAIDRNRKMKRANKIDGATQRSTNALENRRMERDTTTKAEMVVAEHFEIEIIETTGGK